MECCGGLRRRLFPSTFSKRLEGRKEIGSRGELSVNQALFL